MFFCSFVFWPLVYTSLGVSRRSKIVTEQRSSKNNMMMIKIYCFHCESIGQMLSKNYGIISINQYNTCWYKQWKKSHKTLPILLSILMAAGKIQNTFVKLILSTQQGHAWLVLHLFSKFTFRGHQPRRENTGNQNHSS